MLHFFQTLIKKGNYFKPNISFWINNSIINSPENNIVNNLIGENIQKFKNLSEIREILNFDEQSVLKKKKFKYNLISFLNIY